MNIAAMRVETFLEELSSKAPVPGGGGASAVVAAVGTALGNMVGSLTAGKKKYADVEADIVVLNEKAARLCGELTALGDADAEAFEPLSRAYGLPKDTEEQRAEKDRVMEEALNHACGVPMEIMHKCCAAMELLEEYEKKGTVIAISDVGVGIAFLKAALQGASLNVFINTKAMKNKETAGRLNEEASGMLAKYLEKADEIYRSVTRRLEA